MGLRLVLEDHHPENLPWWAMAWHVPGEAHVLRPWDRFFFADARIAHEAGHEDPDEGHHPWWHLCLRSPGGLRVRWTHSRVTHDQVVRLRETVGKP